MFGSKVVVGEYGQSRYLKKNGSYNKLSKWLHVDIDPIHEKNEPDLSIIAKIFSTKISKGHSLSLSRLSYFIIESYILQIDTKGIKNKWKMEVFWLKWEKNWKPYWGHSTI